MPEIHKISHSHLRRKAMIYIRQSTLHQVFENTESTQRQYALRNKAMALGWPVQLIEIIDEDLGQSGASSADRAGFQRLVGEVSLGRVGVVLGLEVSRLARNSADWYQLLELCSMTDTLICDEDGLYDPHQFNDRLLLGLKGTMSEAELHFLKTRLVGGVISKAKRGELKSPLPIGFVYDPNDRVVIDPDQSVQQAIRLLFETFNRTQSASQVVRYFRTHELTFPRRMKHGPHKGEVIWGELLHNQVLKTLHNPRYAGVFYFGRTRTRKSVDGKYHVDRLPMEEWIAMIPDAHVGYITWAEFQHNERTLKENAQSLPFHHGSAPREGSALLQGLVICGKCGRRMTVRYHTVKGVSVPDYTCQRDSIEHSKGQLCQSFPGDVADSTVEKIVLETLQPETIRIALQVQDELIQQQQEIDQLLLQQVEKARYEAELAQRRYMRVDPDNRLVASSLEAEWNERLRAFSEAQESYERRKQEKLELTEQRRREIEALARDIPRLWHDPATPARERKRLVRLMIADVTLHKSETLEIHIRFPGGTTQSLTLPKPLPITEIRRTDSNTVQLIDELLDSYPDRGVADKLNERGIKTFDGKSFTKILVANIRRTHELESHYKRLRRSGWLTIREIGQLLDIQPCTVKQWRIAGLLDSKYYDDRNFLLAVPSGPLPKKHKRKGIHSCGPSHQKPIHEKERV